MNGEFKDSVMSAFFQGSSKELARAILDGCALEDLTRTKEDARRLIRAARRTLFELEYAVKWAGRLLSEDEEGGRPWN